MPKTAAEIWAEGYDAGDADANTLMMHNVSGSQTQVEITSNPYADQPLSRQRDPYGPPFLREQSYGTAYWFISSAFNESPVLSMLTRDAREALARIAADALPKEENA